MKLQQKTVDFLKLALLVLFFVLAVLLAQSYQPEIIKYLDFGYLGMLIYVLLGITSTVIAPVSTIALIPIATALWGGFVTALLNITAWTVGAIIAFLISRRYGKPLVEKYSNLEKIAQYEQILGTKYIFWNLVVLRMIIPVDILSYAIGLFTAVKLTTYASATLIGVTPFAFILSYLPTLPLAFQIGAGALILFVIYFGYKKLSKHKKDTK